MEGIRRRFLSDLAEQVGRGTQVCLYFDTQGALDRFKNASAGDGTGETPFHLQVGSLSDGFQSAELGLVLITEADLYGTRKISRERYNPLGQASHPDTTAGLRVSDWTEIEPGDPVVHVEHGIGRYLGLREIVFDGRLQEVLAIEYADKARLYVPASQAHLLTRYVGIGKRLARSHRLGGQQWNREKATAERAIRDFASSLLEVQASRNLLPGHAFGPDTPWQHQFEAAFPYRETRDQERAITEVKSDMGGSRPMDRLVCGDAGYGKTEVAVRAAFKAVMGGKQVAVLVPTTILAQQHFNTFAARMAA